MVKLVSHSAYSKPVSCFPVEVEWSLCGLVDHHLLRDTDLGRYKSGLAGPPIRILYTHIHYSVCTLCENGCDASRLSHTLLHPTTVFTWPELLQGGGRIREAPVKFSQCQLKRVSYGQQSPWAGGFLRDSALGG